MVGPLYGAEAVRRCRCRCIRRLEKPRRAGQRIGFASCGRRTSRYMPTPGAARSCGYGTPGRCRGLSGEAEQALRVSGSVAAGRRLASAAHGHPGRWPAGRDENGEDRPEERPLLVVARRWPRMLLAGLPGVGKSLALRQLAATWAGDSRAPVPVLVSLRTVARRCSVHGLLTLSVLCEAAAQGAPPEQRAVLAAALEELCGQGEAVLMLDGLDECLGRRALIADGLSALLGSLPPETGVILATRASGERARAGWAYRPYNSSSLGPRPVMQQLLEHVAAVRAPERDRRHGYQPRRLAGSGP